MSKLKFSAFGAVSLQATVDTWTEEAEKGLAFPSDVEQVLTWTASHVEHVDGDSVAYGVFPENSEVASGICEIVISRGGSRHTWVKFLRLRLRPTLDDRLFRSETGAMAEAVDVFAHAVIGVMRLKMTHKAPTLKVYGRTKEQLNFLQQTALMLGKVTDRHDILIEGRFLVIRNKGK